jgi:hypothetical protein
VKRSFLALLLLCSGCGFMSAPPAKVVSDAFSGARSACEFYSHVPAKDHTKDADKACELVRATGVNAPAPLEE